MNKAIAFSVIFLILLSSCKTLTVNNRQYVKTNYPVALGSLGQDKEGVLGVSHTQLGEVTYNRIKVSIKPVAFNKQSYKAFLEAKSNQAANVMVHYVDSIKQKPNFLNIEIADRVGLITMLNDPSNKTVKKYLMDQSDAQLVTRVSGVFNQANTETLLSAQEVYLEPHGLDAYVLKTYNGSSSKTITFKESVVFAYKPANCCWKENSKYQLEIVDLVESGQKCPYKSYQWPNKAKKKLNYYKL